MRYAYYGNAAMTGIEHTALCEHNRKNGDLLARAENSGSEGCYVEVARWSYERNRWERFCFVKFLGGEDREREDWPVAKLAEHHANEINNAARSGQDRLPLIHNLPDRRENKRIA